MNNLNKYLFPMFMKLIQTLYLSQKKNYNSKHNYITSRISDKEKKTMQVYKHFNFVWSLRCFVLKISNVCPRKGNHH